jgi:hypothetical protein
MFTFSLGFRGRGFPYRGTPRNRLGRAAGVAPCKGGGVANEGSAAWGCVYYGRFIWQLVGVLAM